MGLRVELFARIRRDARVEELSIRELAVFHKVHRSVPRSLRRLLYPHDHGSLEDIPFHPQFGVLGPQPLQLLNVTLGQTLDALTGLPDGPPWP